MPRKTVPRMRIFLMLGNLLLSPWGATKSSSQKRVIYGLPRSCLTHRAGRYFARFKLMPAEKHPVRVMEATLRQISQRLLSALRNLSLLVASMLATIPVIGKPITDWVSNSQLRKDVHINNLDPRSSLCHHLMVYAFSRHWPISHTRNHKLSMTHARWLIFKLIAQQREKRKTNKPPKHRDTTSILYLS